MYSSNSNSYHENTQNQSSDQAAHSLIPVEQVSEALPYFSAPLSVGRIPGRNHPVLLGKYHPLVRIWLWRRFLLVISPANRSFPPLTIQSANTKTVASENLPPFALKVAKDMAKIPAVFDLLDQEITWRDDITHRGGSLPRRFALQADIIDDAIPRYTKLMDQLP